MMLRCQQSRVFLRRSFHYTRRLRFTEEGDVDRYQRSNVPDEPQRSQYEYPMPYSPEVYKQRQQNLERTRFADLKIVRLGSGKGGDGRVSFLRDANRSKGPPDGGDGGRGGSVYIQAVEGENSLNKIRFHYKAEDGKSGGANQLAGRNGQNLLLQVPVGTVVKWTPDPKTIDNSTDSVMVDTTQQIWDMGEGSIMMDRVSYNDGEGWLFKDKDEDYHLEREYFQNLKQRVKFFDLITRRQEMNEDLFPIEGLDLDIPGPPQLLFKGGRGGLGNMHFQTPTIRNPRFAKQGRGSVESWFLLELKLIADLGLVGLPNAGKSTLLRAISRARPRVGHWEFTTLNPTIGTIITGIEGDSFTVADIPGIIKGSSENKGMGLDFLRHVERSGGVVFIISLDRDPVEQVETLMNEMGEARMKNKNVLAIGTKADLENSKQYYTQLREYAAARHWDCVPCCAEKSHNVEAVIKKMHDTVKKSSVL